MKRKNQLTEKEEMMMELLWQKKQPLTSTDMFQHFKEQGWYENNVYRSINSLLDKGLIRICGMELCHSPYARKFEPILTKNEYIIYFLQRMKKGTVADIMTALVMEDDDDSKNNDELIAQLESIVRELRSK